MRYIYFIIILSLSVNLFGQCKLAEVFAVSDLQNIPFHLKVYLLTIPKKSYLNTAIWFSLSNKYYNFGQKYSEKYFHLIKVYAQNMAAHRRSVFHVSLRAIKTKMDKNGHLHFDFSNFNRCVKIYEKKI